MTPRFHTSKPLDPNRPLHGYSGHLCPFEGTRQPLHVRLRPALAIASRVVTGAAIGAWLALFAWHGFEWAGRVM
jgi:hypothetical protein